MSLSSRRSRIVAAAFLVFLLTTALRTTAESSADAVLTLLTIPVVMIAFEFGWRGGAVAAALALAWVVVWHAIGLSPLGYFSRGMTYFAAGLIVGSFADRLRAAQSAVVRSERRVAQLALEQQEQFRAAVKERERLARELHDVIAHSVSVMTVQSTAARRVLEEDPPRAAGAMEAVERTGREAMGEMRRMVSVLRPGAHGEMLTPQPSIEDLSVLVDQMEAAGLRVTMKVEGEPRAVPVAVGLSAVQDRPGGADQHAQARGHGAGGRCRALCPRDDRDRMRRRRRARKHVRHRERWTWARRHAGARDSAWRRGDREAGAGRWLPRAGEAPSVMSIRVLIADDQQLVRSGFRMMLEAEGDIEVIAEAADGQEAVELTRNCVPTWPCSTCACPAWTGSRPPS